MRTETLQDIRSKVGMKIRNRKIGNRNLKQPTNTNNLKKKITETTDVSLNRFQKNQDTFKVHTLIYK